MTASSVSSVWRVSVYYSGVVEDYIKCELVMEGLCILQWSSGGLHQVWASDGRSLSVYYSGVVEDYIKCELVKEGFCILQWSSGGLYQV